MHDARKARQFEKKKPNNFGLVCLVAESEVLCNGLISPLGRFCQVQIVFPSLVDGEV